MVGGLPANTSLSVQQFLTLCPTLPIHHILPGATFFVCSFSWMKKSHQGKHYANVGEVNQKRAEVLKGIKIEKFKNLFWAVEKHLDRCIASKGEYFEDNWSLNM